MSQKNYNSLGFIKVTTASPKLWLGQPLKNAQQIIKIFKKEVSQESLIVSFPELSLTGYSCEDLFLTQELLEQTRQALLEILQKTTKVPGILVVGHPYQNYDGKLYNAASVIFHGKILAMIPKSYRPNYGEFYEKRWFSSGLGIHQKVNDFNQNFLLSSQQLINLNHQLLLGVEICEDLWAPNPPSVNLALNGANVIVNLSASNELVNKAAYRKELILQQSARLNCAYLYASAGAWESSKDVVFGGDCLITENGSLIAQGERFSFKDQVTQGIIDLEKISLERRKNSTLGSSTPLNPVTIIPIQQKYTLSKLSRNYSPTPFIPTNPETLAERSEEILQIQATGLARRLLAVNKPKIVLGLSGGLDSTLSLLVALLAITKTNQPTSDILCLSMPGFGTSQRTKDQAARLAQSAGVSFSEIDITQSVLEHFKALNHDPQLTNVVYENSQARERTQILFDKANQVKGIVLGTGDLSELALGWCTFNGDQMSNYNVNASIPKTLVQHLVKYFKDYKTTDVNFQKVLQDILDTKISPELLPPSRSGQIQQETESLIGPYRLHDFFLFHYLRNGFSQNKILTLATLTFQKEYSVAEIKKWLTVFFKRFKSQQFKRTTLPPGPKVGSVSLSPRGDWRCPDEE